MKQGVTIVADKVARVIQGIQDMAATRVMVGIPAEDGLRRPDPATGEAPKITNAALLYIHENGAPEANIPARPSLGPGVTGSKDKWLPYLRRAGEESLEGNLGAADRAYHSAGLTATSAVKMKITEGPFAPLAESTIRNRRRRGRKSTKPLIDTAQMRNAITYVVRKDRGRAGA